VVNELACHVGEVTGSRPSVGEISDINITRIDTVSNKEGVKMVCVHGSAGIAMSADRTSGFHLKVTFGIAIQIQ